MKPTLKAEKPELPEYLNDILDDYEENDYESINCPSLGDVKQAVAQAIQDALKAMELDQMVKDGKIASWTPQVKIILKGENGSKICTYLIDFLVTHLDGSLEYVEIKGFKTAAWRIKYKLLADKLKNDEKARYTVEYV